MRRVVEAVACCEQSATVTIKVQVLRHILYGRYCTLIVNGSIDQTKLLHPAISNDRFIPISNLRMGTRHQDSLDRPLPCLGLSAVYNSEVHPVSPREMGRLTPLLSSARTTRPVAAAESLAS
ncbi:hypothetical protein ElyMa_006968000 [Elysia marginata]|uniref:Uncharacterized protein n=1 Tax=Elysia marginata TaxID=1093978 RepID=A0AAV4JJW3_9GAST|nr:hypothetical protein ElyMa_006968000 [Elysia marginata]